MQMLYRLMTGPFDIPGLDGSESLGNINTRHTPLSPAKRALFANRDAKGARSASATLKLSVGVHKVVIQRRLSDLSLLDFQIDDTRQPVTEQHYEARFLNLLGLGSLGDLILLLRHIVFYFEERRSLIWDPSAQRQLLRLLFLPPGVAGSWLSQERTILELDSRMRNLRAAVSKEEEVASRAAATVETATSTRTELVTLEMLQLQEEERRDALEARMAELDTFRQGLRLELLKVEQQADSHQREYERAKLAVIRASFPKSSDTTAFLLARLLSDRHCLVCGHAAPEEAVTTYTTRAAEHDCLICGTALQPDSFPGVEFAGRSLELITSELSALQQQQSAARDNVAQAEEDYLAAAKELVHLATSYEQRALRISQLIKQLPPDEHDRREQLDGLSALKRRVAEMKDELTQRQEEFSSFVQGENRKINHFSESIKASFGEYASGFLIEECELTWAPYSARVGQTGEAVSFPAFGLEMTGADFVGATRRSSPDQVSESQREFIDLAFRMALMEVSSAHQGASSLLIDAPESSLDAVFSNRAAMVLARFATRKSANRLVITSNLVEGALVPDLIRLSKADREPSNHVVDLLRIATPTAAVRSHMAEYHQVYERILEAALDE